MNRDRTIDLFKVLLVIGMICSHSIGMLGIQSELSNNFSTFINLITFSGFLFCFGYVVNIAYLKKEKQEVSKKLIRNFLEILVVFYISAISYEILILKDYSIGELIKILVLYKLPTLSEFLASFAILNIVTLIFFNQFKYIIHEKKYFIIVLIISLFTTFIPYKIVKINEIGLLIGSTKFYSFPILQYLSYYIIGMYFEENKIKFNFKYFMVSIICSFMFILYVFVYKKIPLRFPPSMLWILGASMFLYVYYIFSMYVVSKVKISKKIYFIGENTLYFLLSSNVILFIIKSLNLATKLNFISSIIIGLLIIILSYGIIYLYKCILRQSKNIKVNENS